LFGIVHIKVLLPFFSIVYTSSLAPRIGIDTFSSCRELALAEFHLKRWEKKGRKQRGGGGAAVLRFCGDAAMRSAGILVYQDFSAVPTGCGQIRSWCLRNSDPEKAEAQNAWTTTADDKTEAMHSRDFALPEMQLKRWEKKEPFGDSRFSRRDEQLTISGFRPACRFCGISLSMQ
jgi:hypothetical protein